MAKNASESKRAQENPRTVLFPIRGASIDPRRLRSADSSATSPAAGETLHTAKHWRSRWETLPTIAASQTCIPRLVTAVPRKPQTFSYFCIKRHDYLRCLSPPTGGWPVIIRSAIGILRIRRSHGMGSSCRGWGVGAGWGVARRPLVTNYQVIIAARLMSEVSVITPARGTVLLLLLQEGAEVSTSRTPEYVFSPSYFLCTHFFKD